MARAKLLAIRVVSYRNSTSNHNISPPIISLIELYLIEILHQTTTQSTVSRNDAALYLIEILHQTTTDCSPCGCFCGCILSKFYIKPQLPAMAGDLFKVVSYRNSTSNHNYGVPQEVSQKLYLIEILHQTTTSTVISCLIFSLYLIEILHQTTTLPSQRRCDCGLYLIEILHQTTTTRLSSVWHRGCILSKFYIKPQLSSVSVLPLSCCILSKFYIKPQHMDKTTTN